MSTNSTRKTSKVAKGNKARRDIYQEVTDRIVAALEAGTAPWRKPWNVRENGALQNLITGHTYRGLNVLLLSLSAMEHGFTSPYWLTANQIKAAGGTWSGKGTQITFWKRLPISEVDEATGQRVTKVIPMLKHFYVWNVQQTEGVTMPKRTQVVAEDNDHTPVEAAEAVIAGYLADGPSLRYGGDRAFYVPALDAITLPERSSFANIDEYYSTAFHEMGHSTGHADRLARTYGVAFGNHEYGREELVAEMTSAFVQAETGIESAEANSAAYLASWIRTLKDDVRAVVVAAGAAQRAADLIMGRAAPEAAEAPAAERVAA